MCSWFPAPRYVTGVSLFFAPTLQFPNSFPASLNFLGLCLFTAYVMTSTLMISSTFIFFYSAVPIYAKIIYSRTSTVTATRTVHTLTLAKTSLQRPRSPRFRKRPRKRRPKKLRPRKRRPLYIRIFFHPLNSKRHSSYFQVVNGNIWNDSCFELRIKMWKWK